MSARVARSLEIDGQAIQVFSAWRALSGLGLAYFAVEEDEESDRRAVLEAGEDLGAMSESDLTDRWAGAAPLSSTERRVKDRMGRHWLIQGAGPVWAEGGAAADAVGVQLRCLSEDLPSLHISGTTPDGASNTELLEALERHLAPPEV